MKIIVKEMILSIIGCLISAFGAASFLLPNKLSSGGFSGIATILYYFLDWQMGTSIILMNIPLFIIAYFKLGKSFFFKSIFSTVVFSKFIDLFENIKLIENDKFLASIYGGVLIGIGMAIIFKSKSSTGGSDLIGQIVSKFNPNFKIASIMVGLDFFIIILNTIFFREIVIGLYSVLTIYIIEKIIDIVFEGVNFCKVVYIISNKSEEISNVILEELSRGVTGIYGKGMYKGNNKIVLMCVTKRREIGKIKEIVKRIDLNSFVIVVDAREVYGLGFKS